MAKDVEPGPGGEDNSAQPTVPSPGLPPEQGAQPPVPDQRAAQDGLAATSACTTGSKEAPGLDDGKTRDRSRWGRNKRNQESFKKGKEGAGAETGSGRLQASRRLPDFPIVEATGLCDSVLGKAEKLLQDEHILLLYGRAAPETLLNDLAGRLPRRRWACYAYQEDHSPPSGPDELSSRIIENDRSRGQRGAGAGVLVVVIPIRRWNSYLHNLVFTRRREASQVLRNHDAYLVVCLKADDEAAIPVGAMALDAIEVPWQPIVVDRLLTDARLFSLRTEAHARLSERLAFRECGRGSEQEGQFCAALNAIPSALDIEELERRIDEIAGRILVRDAAKAGLSAPRHSAKALASYNLADAATEAIVTVAAFLGDGVRRAEFDALCGALLPDDDPVPDDFLPPHRRPPASMNRAAAAAVSWGISWPAPSTPNGTKPATPLSWQKCWLEDADHYHQLLKLEFRDGRVRLGEVSDLETLADELVAARGRRLERLAERITDRGLFLSDDDRLADSASGLLAGLLYRLGRSNDAKHLGNILITTLRNGHSTHRERRLVLRLRKLLDDIGEASGRGFSNDADGLDFAETAQAALTECARGAEAEGDPLYDRLLTMLSCPYPGSLWQTTDTLFAFPKDALSRRAESVRETVADQLDSELRRDEVFDDPPRRLAFLRPLRAWLPTSPDLSMQPREIAALALWDHGLNADIPWGRLASYRDRNADETLAAVAFGADEAARRELVLGLIAFRLPLIARGPESNGRRALEARFLDVVWTTLQGIETADAIPMIEHYYGLAQTFALTALDGILPPPTVPATEQEKTESLAQGDIDALLEMIAFAVAQALEQADVESAASAGGTSGPDADAAAELREMGPFEFLVRIYDDSLQLRHRSDRPGRLASRCLDALDLFHAALIADWFFLRFGLVEGRLSDENHRQVSHFAALVNELDASGLGKRLPGSFARLARIVSRYAPLLAEIGLGREARRIFQLKTQKLNGLSLLFRAAAQLQNGS